MPALFDPRVDEHLVASEGERIVDEVRRHVLAYALPSLIIMLGFGIMISCVFIEPRFAWIPLSLGAAVLLFGAHRFLSVHMDRFVITNIRVFRIHGIFTQHKATMPMSRILDISVHKPFFGRIFRYGHFVFESAAQDQGLRDIRFVGRPDERDLTIQRVIQRAGLRSAFKPFNPDTHEQVAAPAEPFDPEADDSEPGFEESDIDLEDSAVDVVDADVDHEDADAESTAHGSGALRDDSRSA